MELKKISSAGDPVVVKRNRKKINHVIPSICAVALQSLATVYLYSIDSPAGSVAISLILTFAYSYLSYLLNGKPKETRLV